jgi:hypothetical protein
MNVFEDLLEELKDENLIEDSIFEMSARPKDQNGADLLSAEVITAKEDAEEPEDDTENPDFFKKRAMDDVKGLQMVEHVFTGIEREHMKVPPSAYDDLKVKKTLQLFIQVADQPETDQFRDSHAAFMHEMEAWTESLVERDEEISVSNLRRFCETSKPVLSSQALISLANFYRNSPFNESVRGKFDYVMTRLFSREIGGEKRRLLCGRIEMVGHINTLYSKWSSLKVYSGEEYAGLIREQVAAFLVFAAEAEAATALDSMLRSDIFQRIRQAKEDIAELFFAPEITAAVIECNLRIGNRFVDLVAEARDHTEMESLDDIYGPIDHLVSDAAGKTINLIELLKAEPEESEVHQAEERQVTKPVKTVPHFEQAERSDDRRSSIFNVNKWLLAATILIVIASTGLYFWAEQYETSQTVKAVAPEFSVAGSGFEQYVTKTRKSGETVYGVVSPDWGILDDNGRKNVLRVALKFSSTSGTKKVQFVDPNGRTVGFASANRIEVYNE